MWDIFSALFQRYWNDCNYKLILLTDKYESNTEVALFDEVVVLDSTWYEMLMAGVQKADTPYVMLFMDDYLLCDYVRNEDVEKYIKFVKLYKAANIRFHWSEMLKPKTFTKNHSFDFYKPGSAYSFSTQAGIWDVSFLKKYIKSEWTPWDFERKGSVDVRDNLQPLLGTKEYAFPYIEGVRKGKWMKQGYELCRRLGIHLDLEKRPVMTDFEMAWMYFKGGILSINPDFIQKMQNFLIQLRK